MWNLLWSMRKFMIKIYCVWKLLWSMKRFIECGWEDLLYVDNKIYDQDLLNVNDQDLLCVCGNYYDRWYDSLCVGDQDLLNVDDNIYWMLMML